MKLDRPITLSPGIESRPNLTDLFSFEDLTTIGEEVFTGYEKDEQSRERWLRRSRAAMELAMQIKPAKSFPWPNASNVAFPLLTIAAIQFHARIYPAFFGGPDLVKYRVPGVDPTGENAERGDLVSRFMSYQCLDLDEALEEQHDRLFLYYPIVGSGFVKTRHAGSLGHNVSQFVPAEDLVIDYYAKSVDTAQRKTEYITLYRNEVYERCVGGAFRDILDEPWYEAGNASARPAVMTERDRVLGREQPQPGNDSPLIFLEQHCTLDLDGDGYAEPYIVTVEYASRQVVRIVARWELPDDIEWRSAADGRRKPRVLKIRSTEYYTKFELLPSPDGGIYGLGFGALVGPLNEATDTIVNQLVDAGTMGNAAGGFIARGVKIRGGTISFSPFQWNTVESTGEDLKNGIFPLPVREPSSVLFNLLTLLINYTQRISGSTDVMVGENPGQNTPANNMNAMLEQGAKIYSSCFKRGWRAMRGEFRKLFILNARHLPETTPFGGARVYRSFFLMDPSHLVPVADPNQASENGKVQQAMLLKQNAAVTPGYNLPAVEKNFLRALRVDGIETLYPGPDKVSPLTNPKVQVEQIKQQIAQAKLQLQQQEFMATLQEERRVNEAKIHQLEAQAAKLISEADGVEAGHKIAAFEAAVGALKSHNEAVSKRLEIMQKSQDGSEQGSVPGMGGPSGDQGVQGVPPPTA